MRWNAFYNRLKSITGKMENKKPCTCIIVYKDGTRKKVVDDFGKILPLLIKGTEETGIVDIISEYDDGFYDAWKNEHGIFEKISGFEDDSWMVTQE